MDMRQNIEIQNHQLAADRVFAIPELLEHIISYLLCHLIQLSDGEDPKSVRVNSNSRVLYHVLRLTGVGRHWQECIYGSKRFQRALFLQPDHGTRRSWNHTGNHSRSGRLGSYYTAPSMRAPQLNPIIQSTFGSYEFRFWRLDPEKTGNKHCASLIISRSSLPKFDMLHSAGQGQSISSMLLSQPPCTILQANIHDERDETREYVGRTTALTNPLIQCDTGVTLGMVHETVSRMFKAHPDVVAIKFTTV